MRGNFRLALTGAIIAVCLVLPLAIFAIARSLNEGEIAPNVVASGVHLGGLGEEDALATLKEHKRALRETPAPVTVNGRGFDLDPRVVGLDLDVESAVSAAFEARRQGSFFEQFADWVGSFSKPVVIPAPVEFDERALEGVLQSWETTAIGQPAYEGGVSIVGGTATADYPVAGEGIDRDAALDLIGRSLNLVDRPEVTLPTQDLVPVITRNDVDEAVLVAARMVDGPVILNSADPEVSVEIPQETLENAFYSRVETDPEPRLVLGFDPEVLAPALEPHRDAIEQPARNAQFIIGSNDVVTLRSSRPETRLDLQRVADELVAISAGPDRGLFPFRLGERPSFTTEEARAMGPIRRMSSYTTEFDAGQPRVINIQQMARDVDGAIVMPGQTFSLNDHVGQRTEEKGYVPAPMIFEGEFVDDIGGGVSQFATTFFNTVFFGCYDIVEHTPHSYYFPRYPEGREATISWTSPDLVFANDSDALIIIRSFASDTAVSVTFYGNNGGRECTSSTSDRYDVTEPETTYETDSTRPPTGEVVTAGGSQGWTVDVTRTMTHPDGTETTETWTHR
jgi:vancomycin resistance protein YoaR